MPTQKKVVKESLPLNLSNDALQEQRSKVADWRAKRFIAASKEYNEAREQLHLLEGIYGPEFMKATYEKYKL